MKKIFCPLIDSHRKRIKRATFSENIFIPQQVGSENDKNIPLFKNVYKLFTKRKKDRHHFTFKHSEKNHAQNRSLIFRLLLNYVMIPTFVDIYFVAGKPAKYSALSAEKGTVTNYFASHNTRSQLYVFLFYRIAKILSSLACRNFKTP